MYLGEEALQKCKIYTIDTICQKETTLLWTKIKGSFPGVCSEWQSAKINVHTAAAMVTMISRRYVLRDGWVPSVGL